MSGSTQEFTTNPRRIEKLDAGLFRMAEYVASHHSGEVSLFRGRQANIFDDMRAHIAAGHNFGYAKVPCSVGKTMLYIKFAEVTGIPCVVAVPSKDLLYQTQDEFRIWAPNLEVGLYYGDKKELGKPVTLTTYNSLGKLAAKHDQGLFDAYILDEAHEIMGPARRKLVEELKQLGLVMGFTATDTYYENKCLADVLGTPFHSMSIPEAVSEKLMCPFEIIVAETDADFSRVTVQKGEFSEYSVETAMRHAMVSLSAAELYANCYMGRQAIVPCATIDHAIDTAAEFRKLGIEAVSLTSRDSKADRKAKRRDANNGSIQVLTGKKLVLQGLNNPSASVCLNLVPTLSGVVAEQRAGRILRIDPKNPEKFGTIVEFLPKNLRPSFIPILFSDLLEGKTSLGRENLPVPQGNTRPPRPKIQGLKIHIDQEDISALVGQIKKKAGAAGMLGGNLLPYLEQRKLAEEIRSLTAKELTNASHPAILFLTEKFLPLAKALAVEIRDELKLRFSKEELASMATLALIESIQEFPQHKNRRLEKFLYDSLKEKIREQAVLEESFEQIPPGISPPSKTAEELSEFLQEDNLHNVKIHLITAFARLTDREREIFILKLGDAPETSVIANITGTSVSNVTTVLARAWSKLKSANTPTWDEVYHQNLPLGKFAMGINEALDYSLTGGFPLIADEFISLRELLRKGTVWQLEHEAGNLAEPYKDIFVKRFLFKGERPTLESLKATPEMERDAILAIKLRLKHPDGGLSYAEINNADKGSASEEIVKASNLAIHGGLTLREICENQEIKIPDSPFKTKPRLFSLLNIATQEKLSIALLQVAPQYAEVLRREFFDKPARSTPDRSKRVTEAFEILRLALRKYDAKTTPIIDQIDPPSRLYLAGVKEIPLGTLIAERDTLLPPNIPIFNVLHDHTRYVIELALHGIPKTLREEIAHEFIERKRGFQPVFTKEELTEALLTTLGHVRASPGEWTKVIGHAPLLRNATNFKNFERVSLKSIARESGVTSTSLVRYLAKLPGCPGRLKYKSDSAILEADELNFIASAILEADELNFIASEFHDRPTKVKDFKLKFDLPLSLKNVQRYCHSVTNGRSELVPLREILSAADSRTIKYYAFKLPEPYREIFTRKFIEGKRTEDNPGKKEVQMERTAITMLGLLMRLPSKHIQVSQLSAFVKGEISIKAVKALGMTVQGNNSIHTAIRDLDRKTHGISIDGRVPLRWLIDPSSLSLLQFLIRREKLEDKKEFRRLFLNRPLPSEISRDTLEKLASLAHETLVSVLGEKAIALSDQAFPHAEIQTFTRMHIFSLSRVLARIPQILPASVLDDDTKEMIEEATRNVPTTMRQSIERTYLRSEPETENNLISSSTMAAGIEAALGLPLGRKEDWTSVIRNFEKLSKIIQRFDGGSIEDLKMQIDQIIPVADFSQYISFFRTVQGFASLSVGLDSNAGSQRRITPEEIILLRREFSPLH